MNVIEYKSLTNLQNYNWDVLIHGIHDDERDRLIIEKLKSLCSESHVAQYKPDLLNMEINGGQYELHDINDLFFKNIYEKNIVLDATSLDTADLAIICKHLSDLGHKKTDIVYAEPEQYVAESENASRSFNLSEGSLGFEDAGIPGICKAIPIEDKKFIFLMGYEGDRFKNALEIPNLTSKECCLFFGVPAFKFGWDKNSFLSSARTIIENGLSDALVFSGASNIHGCFRQLNEFRRIHKKDTIFIVPIGPKPMAISAIYFLCKDQNSALLYDYPSRAKGRTRGISCIHVVRDFFG